MHGSKYLITDVLKGKMGFDGLTITDWNGHAQIHGCTASDCPRAINAGIDLFMISGRQDVIDFIGNTLAETALSASDPNYVPMTRIDDAVTRILRVKMRAGLFDAPKPSARVGAGDSAGLAHRDLGREAVRKSLVLLKNDGQILPLAEPAAGKKVLVVGKSADSFANQTGGWTLVWGGSQSDSVANVNGDFPTGDTILGGIKAAVGDGQVDSVSDTSTIADFSQYSAVIAVIGELPYAETYGDIPGEQTLEHAKLHPEDLAVLDAVTGKGPPVVTVFISGRPLYVNKELNRSNAFVAAFLPGTEGAGVADLLFKKADGSTNADFTGKLSYSWPGAPCQTPLNLGDPNYTPLFGFGYGLNGADQTTVGALAETTQEAGCKPATTPTSPAATDTLVFFDKTGIQTASIGGADVPYTLYAGSAVANAWGEIVESPASPLQATYTTSDGDLSVSLATITDANDAREAIWKGIDLTTNPPDAKDNSKRAQLYIQSSDPGVDLTAYYPAANAFLVFDVIVKDAPNPDDASLGLTNGDAVHLRLQSTWPNTSNLNATALFYGLYLKHQTGDTTPQTVKIPLRCFDKLPANATNRLDFAKITVPFMILADRHLDIVFSNVTWLPDDGNQVDFVPCDNVPPTVNNDPPT